MLAFLTAALGLAGLVALPRYAEAARAAGPLAYFEFTRDQCLDGAFEPTHGAAISSMSRDLAHTACPDSTGVTFSNTLAGASRLTGYESAVSTIVNGWTTTSEVSWDMWLKSDVPSEGFDKAFVFGLLFSECSKSLTIEQTDELATTSVAIVSGNCIVDTQPFPLQNVTHVTLVKQNGESHMRVYVNGMHAYATTGLVGLEDWRSGFPNLAFGHCASCAKAWSGAMYSFAWYDRALNATEILANYEYGIARSDAVAYNLTITINEDGWAVLPTDPEPYYSEAPVDALYEVMGMSYDFDDEPDNPNYDPNNMRTITITSLPEDCKLYTGQSLQPIEQVPFTLTAATGLSVRLRPTFNLSPFSSVFSFYVTDATTLENTPLAHVHFDVIEVNDPPQAWPSNATFFSQLLQCIALNATDVDNDISELAFTIHDLPQHGQLYMCDGQGVPTTQINDTDTTLPNQYVGYRYEGSEIGGSDVLGVENLEFTVSDGEFNSSSTATFTVYPRLVAQPTCELRNGLYHPTTTDVNLYTVNENGTVGGGINSTVRVAASDVSGIEEAMFFWLETYPEKGSVLLDGDVVPLNTGIPMAAVTGSEFILDLEFVSEPNFFSSPVVTYYDEPLTETPIIFFSYYVSVGDGTVRSLSSVQGIVVKNVNAAPQLTWNAHTLSVKASSKSNIQYLNITGFDIADVDRDVDLVHVQVECDLSCSLYLTQEFPDTYDTCQTCPCFVSRAGTGGWMCNLNNKSPLSKYHFVATPSRAVAVLDTLRFSSSVPNAMVTVGITIFDGQFYGDGTDDKSCIWWGQVTHRFPQGDVSSTRTGCFVSRVDLNVNVEGLATDSAFAGDADDVDVTLIVFLIYGLLAWLVLTALYFMYTVFSKLCKCCKVTGKLVGSSATQSTKHSASNV